MMATFTQRTLQQTIKQIRKTAHGRTQKVLDFVVPASYCRQRQISSLFSCHHSNQIAASLRLLHTTPVRDELVQYKLSDIGEGIREVVLLEWYVKPGDAVEQFDSICEVKSDKATVTITSRFDGVVKKLYHDIDNIALVGEPLVDIEIEGSTETAPEEDVEPEVTKDGGQLGDLSNRAKSLATPAVRRLAMENDLNLAQIKGTGKQGRVLKEDVLQYLASKQAPQPVSPAHIPVYQPPQATPAPTQAEAAPLKSSPVIAPRPPMAPVGQDRVVSFKPVTKAMFRTMTEALQIPAFGYNDEIEVTKLSELRKKLKAHAAERGIQLSYMPIVLKAVSLALHQYPMINATLDAKSETLTYKASHNLGVAMDTPEGLLVPAIKNVQNLSILEIAVELNRLQALGLAGRLGSDDLTGVTFSISNIGAIGGTYMRPVILPPNVAIGAIGKIQSVPKFDVTGAVVKSQIMNVSWSADHRVLDGATMARFSNLWKQYLEEPDHFILDMK